MNVSKRTWLASAFARPPLLDSLDKAVWYSRFVRWRKQHPCPVSTSRQAVYDDVARMERLDAPITYLEFGTFQGASMAWWSAFNTHPESRFVGFDSFDGLPEPWCGYDAGHFATEPPVLRDTRCRLVHGMFQRTLPDFLAAERSPHRQVIFMDADLFSSTAFVLQHLGPRLRTGDVLLFDEFHVWMDEFRAFAGFLTSFPMEYRVLRRSADWSQVAMKVVSNRYGG